MHFFFRNAYYFDKEIALEIYNADSHTTSSSQLTLMSA